MFLKKTPKFQQEIATTFIENIIDTKTIIMNLKGTTNHKPIHRYVIKLKHEWRHKLHKEKFQWDCIHKMKNFNHEQNIMSCIIGESIMEVSTKLFLRPIVYEPS
jgi:hypothetical protein